MALNDLQKAFLKNILVSKDGIVDPATGGLLDWDALGVTDAELADALANLDLTPEVITNFVTNATYIDQTVELLTQLTEITEANTYVTNLITQITAQINGKKGIVNELATLDGSGKLTASQIPSTLATDAEVAAAIAALVNSSPAALDTLKELSDALGADANFATTVTNALAGKQPLDSDLTALAAVSATAMKAAAIPFVIGTGEAVITTGIKGDIVVPFACTITQAILLADQSGSIVVNIWKDTYANFPPVVGDKITASAPPTISGATKSTDSTLTGWTLSLAAGDVLRFNVDSVATIQRVTLVLLVTR